ncbi:hypothetical protein J2X36_000459 [Methylobacterium sp. BE186]|uniref:hypothetical protein n=1 Tax=Methylobacterium sp. BE186 TaxID=2817715 RepID=UPI002854F1DB|nr:hypothetical protein [Methylobacterium sp. BE186]MDR7035723.1 hypothetical protein [Methylobacterium sp. BE186]
MGLLSLTLTRERIGRRYVLTGVRILADPSDPNDVAHVRALQDAISVEQPGEPGTFEGPSWDPAAQKKVRDALLILASTLPDTNRMFGTKDQVDPVRCLIGAASAWDANPQTETVYLNVVPAMNDGSTVYKLAVKDVPVEGFWSVSLSNAEGYYQPKPYNAYSLNPRAGEVGAATRSPSSSRADHRRGGSEGPEGVTLRPLPEPRRASADL